MKMLKGNFRSLNTYEKKNFSLYITPLEFYEGEGLKKFTGAKQNLSEEKVGKELSTGMYFEITSSPPKNTECE
jgi:hypothetical protein